MLVLRLSPYSQRRNEREKCAREERKVDGLVSWIDFPFLTIFSSRGASCPSIWLLVFISADANPKNRTFERLDRQALLSLSVAVSCHFFTGHFTFGRLQTDVTHELRT